MRVAFGASWMPAPTSRRAGACSKTRTPSPARARVRAAVRPPMPAPITTASTGRMVSQGRRAVC